MEKERSSVDICRAQAIASTDLDSTIARRQYALPLGILFVNVIRLRMNMRFMMGVRNSCQNNNMNKSLEKLSHWKKALRTAILPGDSTLERTAIEIEQIHLNCSSPYRPTAAFTSAKTKSPL